MATTAARAGCGPEGAGAIAREAGLSVTDLWVCSHQPAIPKAIIKVIPILAGFLIMDVVASPIAELKGGVSGPEVGLFDGG